MKKILIILALVAGLIACENQKNEFPDFIYTSGYFPYQYPVRTLVLGDYIFDNTNDNNHKFLISAAIGGIYTNKMDRVFNIELVPGLCDKVKFGTSTDTVRLMPAAYYSLSSSDKLVVPKGEVNGGIEVTLNDAFFDDPLAIKLAYVIPVRFKGTTDEEGSLDVDTILRGKSPKPSPDPRYNGPGEWDILPKDFTMFAVKFVNPYHGKYLHRGVNRVRDATTAVIEENIYRQKYNVNDEIWSLVTTGKNTVTVTGTSKSVKLPSQLRMNLTFADDGTCTITQATGSAYTITGSGTFDADSDEWGNIKRDAIHITYQLASGGFTYSATDTLVIRDRAVVMEVFTPTVYTK